MKKTFKRFLAFAMVAVLMANPMSALAAETTEETTSPAIGSADASGDVEGFVDTTIFKVVLPTSAEGTFDFIMDPQGLIAATSGDAYGGTASADFEEDATVFFQTASADAAKKDYKSTSNYIQVLNRGTVDVNVTVEATIDGLSDIAMAADEAAFTSGDAAVPELYLAFTASGDASGDAKDAPVALTKDGAKITAVLDAADQSMYEFNYASGEYTFDLKDQYVSGDADDFADYSFALTGACNSEADWTDVKTAVPAVNVVWTLEDAESGPQVTLSNSGLITFTNLTADANINGATTYTSGSIATTETPLTTDVEWGTSQWTESEGGTLTGQLGSTYMQYYTGQTVTVKAVLTDGTTITASATFN
ncbi:MAG: hypothetical protein J6C01_07100 [Lachnospiraceae bacterium]|nr:hypothetical protein [Lachnospiraceae bacterium]